MKLEFFAFFIILSGFLTINAQTETACDVSAYYFRYQAAQGLNIRSGAGLNNKIVKTLEPNKNGDETYYVFHITGEKNGWYRFNKITGRNRETLYTGDAWVFGEFLGITLPYDENKRIKAYASPNKTSKIVKTLEYETEYVFAGCRGDWVQIGFGAGNPANLQKGWIPKGDYCGDSINDCKSYFDTTAIPFDDEPEGISNGETKCELAAFVSDPASGVNIRSDAGTNFKVVKTIPADRAQTLVFIGGAKGDWLKITSAVNSKKTKVFSGTGWIHAPLLSVRLSGYEGFKSGKMKIYESPDRASPLLDYSSFGIDVPVETCQDDWFKVRLPVTGTHLSGQKVFGWVTRGAFCGSPWEDCN